MHMDEKTRLEVANFRYGLIAPVVSRDDLLPGEQYRLLKEIASRRYQAPGGERGKVSIRSLERYLRQYRRGGLDALKPKNRDDRGKLRVMPPEILQKAADLKKELPQRSTDQIIAILELSKTVQPGLLKRSTLDEHFRRLGVNRKALTQSKEKYRRFERAYRNACWQGDCQHTLYLPDPADPNKKRQVYLIAFIDEFSRVITHAEMYLEENRPRLEDCLKKAILRYGVPHKLYCDNGSIYSSENLRRICGYLNIHLVHSTPYRPQGRGKIEKFFWYVDKSFKPEAYRLIEQGRVKTLAQVNEFFWAWLELAYHRKKHSTTRETPHKKFSGCEREIRRVDPLKLSEIFLWEERRQVDRAGSISLYGNRYEVDSELSGKKVLLRFDPYDLKQIQVFYEGKRFNDATLFEMARERHEVLDRPAKEQMEEQPNTGLTFLELAQKEHERLKKASIGQMDFTRLMAKGGVKI